MNQIRCWLGLRGQGSERSRGGIVSSTAGGPAFCKSSCSHEAVESTEEGLSGRNRPRINAACCPTVAFSKKSVKERVIGNLSRSRAKHWIASSEWPPNEKKLLCGSPRGSLRSFAQ